VGELSNFSRDGEGMILETNGTAYNGQWKNGVKHGEGFQLNLENTKPNKLTILKGTWNEGTFKNESD